MYRQAHALLDTTFVICNNNRSLKNTLWCNTWYLPPQSIPSFKTPFLWWTWVYLVTLPLHLIAFIILKYIYWFYSFFPQISISRCLSTITSRVSSMDNIQVLCCSRYYRSNERNSSGNKTTTIKSSLWLELYVITDVVQFRPKIQRMFEFSRANM